MNIQEKKEEAYRLWLEGLNISQVAKGAKVTRNTATSWIRQWRFGHATPDMENSTQSRFTRTTIKHSPNDFDPHLVENLKVAASNYLKNIQVTYDNCLSRSTEINHQKQVSSAAINLVGLGFQEIYKRVKERGESVLDYSKEMSSLALTLEKAQKVFCLSHGLATENFKVDIDLIAATMQRLPTEALEIMAIED